MPKVIGEASEMLKQTTCRKCAARLEYTEIEVSSKSYKDYGGGTCVVESITCPRCGNQVVIKEY